MLCLSLVIGQHLKHDSKPNIKCYSVSRNKMYTIVTLLYIILTNTNVDLLI